VFGGKPARGLPKPSPTPPRRESIELTRGENGIPGRGRGIQTRNWDAEKGRGGENNAKLNNLSTEQYFGAIFHTKIDSLSSPYCVDRVLYSEGRAYKRVSELAASPQFCFCFHAQNKLFIAPKDDYKKMIKIYCISK
jgi:hypothetical protein